MILFNFGPIRCASENAIHISPEVIEFGSVGIYTSPVSSKTFLNSLAFLDCIPSQDLSLHDVVGVSDPMAKVKPGLVGSGDQEVELKGVHIRAKLLDLAGEVCLLLNFLQLFISMLW